MSAEMLRKAAEKLREQATKATSGPWRQSSPAGHVVELGPGIMDPFAVCHWDGDPAQNGQNAAYIAGMHPGVGLALADWLEAEAKHIASYDCEAHCEPDGCNRSHKALAVARAILGGDS